MIGSRSHRSGIVRPQVAAASVVMLLGIWLSSGTMAPYGATLDSPLILEPCHYVANLDHEQFRATFAFLDGAPPAQWNFSVVLRRMLFPLAAYPLMKAFGFMWGGLLTSMLLHLLALFVLSRFLSRRYSPEAADIGVWLLATYPGIAYWGGLPYSYAIIVPASIVAMILLFRIDESADRQALIFNSLLLGLVFTGYDLLPFFGVASILLVLRKRSLRASLINFCCFLLPSGALAAALLWHPAIPQSNSNTAIYGTIVRSYVDPTISGWGELLAQLPRAAAGSLIFGNFLVLPLAWVLVSLMARGKSRLERVELAIILAVAAVFLFNNLAPPYPGWQMRGEWIARLYQPLFVVMIVALSRVRAREGMARWPGVTAIILNAALVFGPVLGLLPVSSFVYARFYRHGSDGAMNRNVTELGRRPLGVCSEDHRLHDLPRELFTRPGYMYKEGVSR